jgi:ATP-dependent DNA ligase
MARRDPTGVRLITRNGTNRFPLIETAVAALRALSCVVDGEAIVCDKNGLAVFDLMRGHRKIAGAVLCAFDLLELEGRDLRREPIEKRKALLAKLLRGSHLNIASSMNITLRTARLFFVRRVGSGVRVSYPNGLAHLIGGADPSIGSRSRTRTPLP